MAIKKGRQTPTTSFVLPYDKTLSDKAVKVYEKSGNQAMMWQKKILKDIMAIGEDGLWTHQDAGYSIPRRNGKSEVVYIRELYSLMQGEQVAHTAHLASTSHASFNRMYDLLKQSGYLPRKDFKAIKAKGSEEIELYETGGRIIYRTRTGSGGLGEGFDLLVIDEAQEYTDSQRTALVYTVSSSKNPQTVFCGTPPTVVSKGTVFQKMRNATLAGDKPYTCWHEWSVDHITDPMDRSAWYETNPSLGLDQGPHLTERKIEVEIGGTKADDKIDFNIQRLGYWTTYNQKSLFTTAQWDACKAESMPELDGKLFVGIKFGKDGRNASVSVAVKTKDGRIFIESLDCRSFKHGINWIVEFLAIADIQTVAADGDAGKNLLADAMKDARLKPPKIPTVKEITDACSMFEQAIFGKSICHMGQVSLRQSVTQCEKRAIGSNGGFGFRSLSKDIDVGLIESASLAYWACKKSRRVRKQRVSY